MVRPKKYLGQHFLTDPAIARRIVDALTPSPGKGIVEIGPGTGILTGIMMERGWNLIPVEIDRESVLHLKEQWPVLSESLVEGDFLQLDLRDLFPGKIQVIGNFPYNISSQIFFRILEYRQQVDTVVCMLQKEVADRIAAPPGNRIYGILSVLLQSYYTVESLFTVKPGSFFPPPRVQSAVIRLRRNQRDQLPCDEALFFRIIKTVFNQRRKMIRNSIRAILVHLDDEFELLTYRPEQLDIPQFIRLTQWVSQQLEHSHDSLKSPGS
jgi:16S rRNA (adenine1518-N6/adenine1519-N6)-dimethyltransferase